MRPNRLGPNLFVSKRYLTERQKHWQNAYLFKYYTETFWSGTMITTTKYSYCYKSPFVFDNVLLQNLLDFYHLRTNFCYPCPPFVNNKCKANLFSYTHIFIMLPYLRLLSTNKKMIIKRFYSTEAKNKFFIYGN